ncbi:MAG TPA: hypothetical protein DF774_15900 [Rheinheimera sp.]|nr:hypothetical protein [Rheinheimera sp.]
MPWHSTDIFQPLSVYGVVKMTNSATKTRKKSAKLFRSVQLLLAITGLIVLLQWWHDSTNQGQRLFAEQSSVLMRETLKALAQTAAYLIENDQLDGLTALTQQLASSPYLHDVVVYDANGVRLSESSGSEPARLLYAPQHKIELQPMVQEIYQGSQLLGYIKISLKQDTGFSAVSSAWHAMMEQVLWMLALAALVALMARSSLLLLSHKLASNQQLHHAALDSHEHIKS